MFARPRRVWNWFRLFTSFFTLKKRPSRRVLQLDALEDRFCPAVFNPSPRVPDGAPGSLRDAVIQANSNGDAGNTIRLQAGTYTLSVLNSAGQENAAAQGD